MSAKKIDYIEDHKSSSLVVVGYDASKYNALKHGVLSKYTVMHWENREDYDALLSALVAEHMPQGVTEVHLVEELAGSIWRKMRLRYAEMASLQSSLRKNIDAECDYLDNESARDVLLASRYEVENFDIKETVVSSPEELQEELVQARKYLKYLFIAEKTLLKTNSYEKGLAALNEYDQDEWQNECLGNTIDGIKCIATLESLMMYINKSKKRSEKYIYELENRKNIKTQILGKSFFSENDLNKYTKYENHLDKKFEKTLGMLLKLKELRETKQL